MADDKFWQEAEEFEEMAEREGQQAMAKFLSKKNKEKVRLTLKTVEEELAEDEKEMGL